MNIHGSHLASFHGNQTEASPMEFNTTAVEEKFYWH